MKDYADNWEMKKYQKYNVYDKVNKLKYHD